jgi:hypothetical protein
MVSALCIASMHRMSHQAHGRLMTHTGISAMNAPYMVIVREKAFPDVVYDVVGCSSWEIAVAVANRTSLHPEVIAEVKPASIH